MIKSEQKVAVVTGSSSGIGYATSLMLSRNGFNTYASMRNLEKSQGIVETAKKENLPLQVIQLDVDNEKSVKDAVERIISEKGKIDVLVNNAGFGLGGSVEDLSMEELKGQFETNFFGLIRVTQEVLPHMRKTVTRDYSKCELSSRSRRTAGCACLCEHKVCG